MKSAIMVLVIGLVFTLAFPFIQSMIEGAGDEALTDMNYTKVSTDWEDQTDFIQGLFGLLTVLLAVAAALVEHNSRPSGW